MVMMKMVMLILKLTGRRIAIVAAFLLLQMTAIF